MATVRALRALRYTAAAGDLAELVAPPYDVIDAAERARLARQSAANVIHLILPTGEDPYREAATKLQQWQASGWLARDAKPAMYLCSQRFQVGSREFLRWGLLASVKLERLDAGIVLPHERTLAAPKADRLRLIRECRTNLSPIFGLVDESLELAKLAGAATPVARFVDRAGVTHGFWQIADEDTLAGLSERLRSAEIFIADGHHRYETSLGYRDERRAADGRRADDEGELRAYDFILFYLCSTRDPGLVVLPTHRILAAENAPASGELIASWRETSQLTEQPDDATLLAALSAPSTAATGPRVGAIEAATGRRWLIETAAASKQALAQRPPALAALDVTYLHEILLPGIGNDKFRYTHDAREALDARRAPGAGWTFLVPPPTAASVLEISRAQLTMPQKSTYFHPKVLSGLVFHPLD